MSENKSDNASEQAQSGKYIPDNPTKMSNHQVEMKPNHENLSSITEVRSTRHDVYRTVLAVGVVIALFFSITGCGMEAQSVSVKPEESLQLAFSSLSGQDNYSFKGSVTNTVANNVTPQQAVVLGKVTQHDLVVLTDEQGHSVLQDSETPLAFTKPLTWLDQILAVPHRTDKNMQHSGITTAVLDITPNMPGKRAQWVKERQGAFDALQAQYKGADKGTQQKLAQAGTQLQEMLDSLTLDTTYQVTLNERTNKLLSVTELTKLRYKVNGNQQDEQQSVTIEIN
jgi:hypothetical protein